MGGVGVNSTATLAAFKGLVGVCLADYQFPTGRVQRRRVRKRRGARDAAIITLACACGLSVAELRNLQRNDYDEKQKMLAVGRSERAMRQLPVIGNVSSVLRLWLAQHQMSSTFMFFPLSKNGVVNRNSLSQKGLSIILQNRAKRAGISPVSLREFRGAFKQTLRAHGFANNTVRDLMGLASRRRGARDDARADAEMRRALGAMADLALSRVDIPDR